MKAIIGNDGTSPSELRERLGRQARARVEAEFSKETVVEKTLALYEDILSGKQVAL